MLSMMIYTNGPVQVMRDGDAYRITIATAHSSSKLTVEEMTDLCTAVIRDQAEHVPGSRFVYEALTLLFPRGD